MNDTQTDFFNRHSLKFIEMALSTDNIERIETPDGYGTRTGECGDTVEFFLIKKENTLDIISFVTQGCIHTTACCNTVALFAQGKPIEKAWEIFPEDVIQYLETLPQDH